MNILIYKEGAVRCGAVHSYLRCTVTCSAVKLYHFAGGFDTIFTVYAV